MQNSETFRTELIKALVDMGAEIVQAPGDDEAFVTGTIRMLIDMTGGSLAAAEIGERRFRGDDSDYGEVEQAVRQLSRDGRELAFYSQAGGFLLGSIYRSPSDPLACADEMISRLNYPTDQKIKERMREVASVFFPKIGREDLVVKYGLRR